MKRKGAPQAHKRLILSILAGVVLFAAGAGAGGAYVTLFGATSSRHAQAVTTPKDTPHHTTNGPRPSDEAVYTPDFSFP